MAFGDRGLIRARIRPLPPSFLSPKGIPVDLKVPITIVEEFSEDDEVNATGLLDMASGDITRVEYEDYDVGIEGLPCEREDYEFSVGILRNRGKEVEFRVDVNKTTGQYSVSVNELQEIKTRAAALFAAGPN